MGFFEQAFTYVNSYQWSWLIALFLLSLTNTVSMDFVRVSVILLGMSAILEIILSGTWVWGSSRTNSLLLYLFLNVFILMYVTPSLITRMIVFLYVRP